ncbi:MAG: hypothetical protein RBJ76_02390 [Stenomitos frigidus ULC029]
MKQQIEQRLHDLTAEFESGQTLLAELETRQATLKSTLLRISGAIQVLEELLIEAKTDSDNHHYLPDHLPPTEAVLQPD